MDYTAILNHMAPCGLSCEKCFAHIDGHIRKYAVKLQDRLGNFDVYAQRFQVLVGDPVFTRYPQFKEMLSYLASANCQGCRKENCKLFRNCGVRSCSKEKKLDYCFQCAEFPCEKTNFDEHLYKRWVLLNERIREVGIHTYYAETSGEPRYK